MVIGFNVTVCSILYRKSKKRALKSELDMIYAELANPGILNVLVGATNVIEHDDASSETDAKGI